ncbi:MAG: TlpA family protein disulfide reductase [Chloroflexi bacterium]|nr:TlpA family protein disulfide reductase [Chloroflexota bacterium]
MIRRVLLMVGAIVPVIGVMGLMAWALGQTGGNPGGLGINSVFGEVEVEPAPAPPLSLRLLTGEALTLADLEGKVVMVDFWSSWCPPCIEEAPVLAATYPLYADRGVVFVGVAIWDDDSEVSRHIERYGVTYLNGIDAQGKVAINYGVRGIPEKYFIDRNGLLVKKFVGPVTAGQLRAILDEMLSQGGEA